MNAGLFGVGAVIFQHSLNIVVVAENDDMPAVFIASETDYQAQYPFEKFVNEGNRAVWGSKNSYTVCVTDSLVNGCRVILHEGDNVFY